MDEQIESSADAQSRIEQIEAFQEEMKALEISNTLILSPDQKSAIEVFHSQLLEKLRNTYDVDTNSKAKQLTLGMKIASLLGALAMAMSIFFLFYQFWGYLSTPIQVTALVTAPVSLFLLTIYLTQKDKSAYFSKISGLVCLASFVLNLSMLGQIFNVTPSPNAFLIWSAFGFLLAYACNAKLIVFFAMLSLSGFIAMKIGTWSGIYWISFGERPEHFILPSLILFSIPHFIKHSKYPGFDVIYRVTAMIMLFLPLLVLANWGELSYLTWDNAFVEGSYQILGFAVALIGIWLGIKKHWHHVTNTSNVFFILFLYTKFFDWWWQWMPKYIFFFLVGLTALLALFVFNRIRTSQQGEY